MSGSERVQQPQAAAGSTTVVATPTAEATEAPVYRVQLQPRARVTFDESAIDNEHMGRKKSNSEEKAQCAECCIFHKKRDFGESSSESGEDSSDDEEQKKRKKEENQRQHHRSCKHGHSANGDGAKEAETH